MGPDLLNLQKLPIPERIILDPLRYRGKLHFYERMVPENLHVFGQKPVFRYIMHLFCHLFAACTASCFLFSFPSFENPMVL